VICHDEAGDNNYDLLNQTGNFNLLSGIGSVRNLGLVDSILIEGNGEDLGLGLGFDTLEHSIVENFCDLSNGGEACFRKRKTALEEEYENYEKMSRVGGFLLGVDVGGNFKQLSVAKSSFEECKSQEWSKILQGPIFCIAVSAQLGAIYVSTGNGFMYEIDIDGQKIKRNWGKIHERSIYCMALTHKTRRLFTGGIDKELKEWDLEKKVLARNWGVWQTNSILKMTVTVDDRFIYTAGADLHLLKIAIKNPEDDSLDYGIVHRNVITCMQITQNGLILATCSNHSDIKMWSVSSDEIFLVIPRGTSYNISSIMLTPDS
jgi:WD40 repeat protein